MLKVHEAVLLTLSTAVQTTGVVPALKMVVPIGGSQETDGVLRLSVAVGANHDTTPVARSLFVELVTSPEHVMTGGVVSCTEMTNVQLALLPPKSVATQVTEWRPRGRFVPEAGVQTTELMPTLSEPVGVV